MLKEKLSSFLGKLKKLRKMHYFIFGAVTVILVELALLLAPVQKTNAVWWGNAQPQHYQCGSLLRVILSPSSESSSACSNSGYDSNMTSYSASMTLKAERDADFWSTGAYTVHWAVASYWCPNEDPTAPCISSTPGAVFSDNGGVQTGYLTGDNAVFTTLTGGLSSSGQFSKMACGYYQNDYGFWITLNDSNAVLCGTAGFRDSHVVNDLGSTNSDASWCHTGNTCSAPTPTPTVTLTPTPTVTSVPSNTPTPTPTSEFTPTPTPTGVPSSTPTPTPTGELTSTPTPTMTVTPTPTITLTPTVTPTGTLTPTATPTITMTPTETPTGTLTPTMTPTNTPTGTLTPTNTPTNTPTGTVTPVLGASTSQLPPAPLTQTPKTGPSALVWILELVGVLPLGLFLRKNAKLK